MADYRCFFCKKDLSPEYVNKKIRCPYCGSKIIFKKRVKPTKVIAR